MLDNASFMPGHIGSQKSPNVVSEYLNFQPDIQKDIIPNRWQLHSQLGALPNFTSDFPSLMKKPWLWIPRNQQLSLWGPLHVLYSQHQQSEPGALSLILSYSRLLLFASHHQTCIYLTETSVWCAGCWPSHLSQWGNLYLSMLMMSLMVKLRSFVLMPYITMILLLNCYYVETAGLLLYLQQ